MEVKSTEVAIVGGGQAGLALSYRLTEPGRAHVILEQRRVVESWRTKRWDSLRLIAPSWSLLMPGFEYPGDDPDGFMARDEVVQHLTSYAASFGAPVVEGVRVTSVERDPITERFRVQTDDGTIEPTMSFWRRAPSSMRRFRPTRAHSRHRSRRSSPLATEILGFWRLEASSLSAAADGCPDRGGTGSRRTRGAPIRRPELVGATQVSRPRHGGVVSSDRLV